LRENMKKYLFVLCILLSAFMPGFALSLEDLAGQEKAVRLNNGESLSSVLLKDPRIVLAPNYAPLLGIIRQEMEALRPSVFIETMRLYRKPEGADMSAWTAAERLNVYNGSLALSTLAGIQYFSASRNEWRTLYESSSVVDSPDRKQPLPDPVYQSPPAELTLYARQKDLTFGDNVYRYRYFAYDNAMLFVQENVTSLSMGIIPAVGRGRLRSIVAVIDTGPGLLIYALSMARAASFPGMGTRIGNSFTTRVDAVLSWFFSRVDTAFSSAAGRR
jgi:hypothetical protein